MGQSVEAQIFLTWARVVVSMGRISPSPTGRMPGQPPQAAAPEQVEQDGLSIVIRGVGRVAIRLRPAPAAVSRRKA